MCHICQIPVILRAILCKKTVCPVIKNKVAFHSFISICCKSHIRLGTSGLLRRKRKIVFSHNVLAAACIFPSQFQVRQKTTVISVERGVLP